MPETQPTYGPWRCTRELGRGGNGVVWLAVNDEGQEVALKVVNARRPDAEPYQRFVREITFLGEISPFDGVLPVIDAYLPEPGVRKQPWLAMPVATPITVALTDRSLETVVDSVKTIAGTLAQLAAEHGLGHRDVKPGNLYELDGAWLVGDFGLIDLPDVEELTRSNRPLGPAHFTAYEVVADARDAPTGPADVFSLGKTLWVLATGQRWPPLGHQRADTTGYRISDFHPHVKADHLDRLVDRMTRLEPEARPTMAEVAEDLAAWERLTLEQVDLDISDLSARYRARQVKAFARRDQEQEWRRLGGEVINTLNDRVQELWLVLGQLDPEAQTRLGDDKFDGNELTTIRGARGGQERLTWWCNCGVVRAGSATWPFLLRTGVAVDVFDDGALSLRWMIEVGPQRANGFEFQEKRFDFEARVGSVAQEELMDQFIENHRDRLRPAIEVFVDKAPIDA